MPTHCRPSLAASLATLGTLGALVLTGAAPVDKPEPLKISGPYTHDNLSVFLIHGEDQLKGKKLLTLAEALAQKKVIVHETGDVNELSIENRSNDDVFVQSGDIVKGGRQDRVLSLDVILPPKSGKIPISAFCVEQGRWSGRHGESAQQFGSSNTALASKKLKLAARKDARQDMVWKEVAETQSKLGAKLKTDVKSAQSATSLQLTLENKDVEKRTAEYLAKLSPILDGKTDVVGYAFAINGRVNSAEVYASPALLKTLWPKLIRSNVVEAIAEHEEKDPAQAAAPEAMASESDVRKLLAPKPAAAKKTEKKVTGKITLTTVEDDDGKVLFETRDESRPASFIHRSYY